MSDGPPPGLLGMRHIALRVSDMARSRAFYERVLGMKVVWEPDPDNVYLSSGQDNIALHTANSELTQGTLDHFGFILSSKQAVDEWAAWFESKGHAFHKSVKNHRDGSRSFYVCDPDGNVIQMLYEPSLSAG